jgi:hypothetical protein
MLPNPTLQNFRKQSTGFHPLRRNRKRKHYHKCQTGEGCEPNSVTTRIRDFPRSVYPGSLWFHDKPLRARPDAWLNYQVFCELYFHFFGSKKWRRLGTWKRNVFPFFHKNIALLPQSYKPA